MKQSQRNALEHAQLDAWLFKWVAIMAFIGFACSATAVGFGVWWIIKSAVAFLFGAHEAVQ